MLKFTYLWAVTTYHDLYGHCSAHKCTDVIELLRFVNVSCFPPNTTSVLEPMDASTIAALTKRDKERQMMRVVDNIDVNVDNIYIYIYIMLVLLLLRNGERRVGKF